MAMTAHSRAGFLPTAMTVLWTAPAGGALIKGITATNDPATQDVFASFDIALPAPNAGTDRNRNIKITPEDKKISVLTGELFVPEGTMISGMGSSANTVTYFISAVGGYFGA